MQSQLTHTKILIKLYHILHEFLCGLRCCQRFAQITDTVPDTGIKHLAVASGVGIITENLTAGNSKCLIQYSQVKIIQFFKHTEIIQCQFINTSVDSPSDLTGCTECIFIIYQKKCQITVP